MGFTGSEFVFVLFSLLNAKAQQFELGIYVNILI